MISAVYFYTSLAAPTIRRVAGLLGALLLAVVLVACQSGSDAGEERTGDVESPPVVEITAVDYAFVAPDTIPSGWVTFRLNNEKAEEVHELDLSRLPEGVSYSDFEETIPVWGSITEQVQAGELGGPGEVYAAAEPKLPDWAENAEEVTGRGIVSPGRVTEKTVYLEPGTHAMFCFVKSPDGQAHIAKGMSRKLVVTDADANAEAPDADVEVTVSGRDVDIDGALSPGTNTVAARFDRDRKGYETIHLIRVADDTNLEEVEEWLNWYNEDGLMAPAPADFLGGNTVVSDRPKGNVAYFTIEDLDPGPHAWVVWTFEDAFSETFTVE